MFYLLIKQKRDEWYNSSSCTVKELIEYMVVTNKLREVQIDAIKTYLFLKIACKNKPLWQLFYEGAFNIIDVSSLEIAQNLREYMLKHPCALALYQYATTKNDKGEQVSAKLEEEIKKNYYKLDYAQIFKDIFYDVSYTDYLFSLPMGAGKTFLMACFIYIDMYFSLNEPDNRVFAHNFIIFAPSGLKNSVVPSLKTIRRFKPCWVIPEPAASKLNQLIKFEILDHRKTGNKSNKIKNPNVQKLASYQPLENLFGLVAITNAEKVILDRAEPTSELQLNLMKKEERAKYRASNELRSLISKIPDLSIFIDEVHHATNESIKLRNVVSEWGKQKTLNSVIGFSGTPYMEKADNVVISDKLKIQTKEIANVVHYFPLVKGIGTFLKRPVVKISKNFNRIEIVEQGLREFLNKYKDKVYLDGTKTKIGIYCGTIETLEEIIYPLCSKILSEYKINPDEAILKFHKGNKIYHEALNSEKEFEMLDSNISKIRVVLLVQVGKEGWDCKSLTGVILSHEGDCPVNMVLQTCCRCLRYVDKDGETALIYLNESNADTLQTQLQKRYHIGLKEFESGNNARVYSINRYSRMDRLKVPPIEFYQFKVEYKTVIVKEAEPEKIINAADNEKRFGVINEQDFITGKITGYNPQIEERGEEIANFNFWLYKIVKESLGTLTFASLKHYERELREIFDKITYKKNGVSYFSSKFYTRNIEANIRKSFCQIREIKTEKCGSMEAANLLISEKLITPIETIDKERYVPDSDTVEKIINEDKGYKFSKTEMEAIKFLRSSSNEKIACELEQKAAITISFKDKTYHYLPYKMDSSFERMFLDIILQLKFFKENGLEVYYNGDETLTNFIIKTYKKTFSGWNYIGKYTPDFLIIKREDKIVKKVMIVETKGTGYADNFKDKREFMNEFIKQNNKVFKYKRFDFLYLQDNMSEDEIIQLITDKLQNFFEGAN